MTFLFVDDAAMMSAYSSLLMQILLTVLFLRVHRPPETKFGVCVWRFSELQWAGEVGKSIDG